MALNSAPSVMMSMGWSWSDPTKSYSTTYPGMTIKNQETLCVNATPAMAPAPWGGRTSTAAHSPPSGTICNNCHYYYSDFHAGMSCGSASCHVSDRMYKSGTVTLHAMSHQTGSGGTRAAHETGLVLKYGFENNLKDSGGWEMNGKWMDDLSGSFTTGKVGQALVLLGGKNVQVGTENGYWSTDAGYHGTWVYTEMKYNTTLEAWVYPTNNAASEYVVFSKHTGYTTNGGYQLALKKIGNTLRAVFNMAADNNGATQDGRADSRC